MLGKVKINNYFYQFEIQKKWMDIDKIIEKLYNNITLQENIVSKDYEKIKIHTWILSVSEIEKEWQYRVVFLKWPYWHKLNFIEKDIDLTKISWEKEVYWVDSWKKDTQMEEIHYYCTLKIWISENNDFIRWLISILRVRDWINSEEIWDILKLLFDKILWVWYYRNLRTAYSEWKILSVFSSATEINFMKDVYIDDFIWSHQQQEEGKTMWTIKIKVSWYDDISKWKQKFTSLFSWKTEVEIKQELTPLRNFSIKTKNWTFSFE